MNQQQRRYIVKELEVIKNNKLNESREKSDSNKVNTYNTVISDIIKLFKSGELKLSTTIDAYKSIPNITTNMNGEYLTRLVRRGYATIDDSGSIRITPEGFVRSTAELSSSMITVGEEWNCAVRFRNIIRTLKDVVGSKGFPTIDAIADKTTTSDKEAAIMKAYKEAERLVMLGTSEEMIKVISDFEELSF